jgi:hypothetical protein
MLTMLPSRDMVQDNSHNASGGESRSLQPWHSDRGTRVTPDYAYIPPEAYRHLGRGMSQPPGPLVPNWLVPGIERRFPAPSTRCCVRPSGEHRPSGPLVIDIASSVGILRAHTLGSLEIWRQNVDIS